MNYIDEVKEELSKYLTVGKGLMNYYSLLVLIKGEETTLKDVHDSWSMNINTVWDREVYGDHRSLIPFDELTPEIQAKDQRYLDAIHETTRMLKERSK